MPLYDYACRACGRTSEALVRDQTIHPSCPHCSSSNTERLPSLFAVSTDSTRQTSLTKVRAANLPAERDKAIAHEEYVDKHHPID